MANGKQCEIQLQDTRTRKIQTFRPINSLRFMHANVLLARNGNGNGHHRHRLRLRLQYLSVQLAKMSAKWPQTDCKCVPSARVAAYTPGHIYMNTYAYEFAARIGSSVHSFIV